MLDAIAYTLHVILAGAWLGGVVFTTTVVSPALKSMGWDEAEQARVRSAIGHQYAKVGIANLVPLGRPYLPQHPLGCARAAEGARELSNWVAKSLSVEGG
jgi:hypothetical protein